VAGNALKVALTFTAIDAASEVVRVLENRILGLGKAGAQVKKDFESMVSNTQAGLKSLAASYYSFGELKPGIKIAADMQTAMTELEMSLQRSGKNAADLVDELKKFRGEAERLQKIHPFGAREMVEAETVLVQAGMKPADILGGKGAAASSAMLATISHSDPKTMAQSLSRIGAAFDLKGNQYWDLANFMQKVATSTPLKIPEMMEALKYSSQMSAAMKLDLKDTLTALAVLTAKGAPGSMAGTETSAFLMRLTGATRGESKAIKEAGFEFWDEKGNLKNWDSLIKELQGEGANPKIAGKSMQELMTLLIKIFQMRGERGALALAGRGDNSFAEMRKRIEESSEAEQKLSTRLQDLNAQITALEGTTRTAVANAFDPMLHTLAEMSKVANDLVDTLGKVAAEHRRVTGGLDTAAAIGVGGAAAYGLYRLGKGAYSGSRMLAGLRSTALGVAEGKALEKAAGVTPVFVTNWPDGLGGSAIPLPGKTPGLVDRLGRPIEAAVSGGAAATAAAGASTLAAAAVATGVVAGTALALKEAVDASQAIGKGVADWQSTLLSDKELRRQRARQMVMGGGPASYQIGTIDRELAARTVQRSGAGTFAALDAHISEVEALIGKTRQEAMPPQSGQSLAGKGAGAQALTQISHAMADDIAGRNLHVTDTALEGHIARVEELLGKKPKNEITLNIRVDQNGRVTSSSNDPDTTARINLKRGDFFE
jgi:TP901 family phage tail tape measure protein